MEEKEMGKYLPVERALSRLSSDEINELFLSGELHNIYDEFDRTGNVEIKKKRKGGNRL